MWIGTELRLGFTLSFRQSEATRNPSFFYGNLNPPGAPPFACEKVLRVPVPGFHRAQGFAVFERSRSFFAVRTAAAQPPIPAARDKVWMPLPVIAL
jgi:hypothetical protein